MARRKEMDTRKLISMPAELVERIKRFRFSNEINTEAEAIRLLIEMGLETAAKRQKEPK